MKVSCPESSSHIATKIVRNAAAKHDSLRFVSALSGTRRMRGRDTKRGPETPTVVAKQLHI